MFKWVCLLVAVAALSAFGWMLNDVRLEIKRLTAQADQHLPRIIAQTERVTTQLDTHLPQLLNQTETAATNINTHLPTILTNSEKASVTLNTHLPTILANSEKATTILTADLPKLVITSEAALTSVAELSDSFGQYKGLLGIVHAPSQKPSLMSYGASLLGFLGGTTNATVGQKKPGTNGPLTKTMPASEFAAAATKDLNFFGVAGSSKADVLHGIAKTASPSPWHIQVGDAAPKPLADWVKENHPDSKDMK